MGGGMHSAGGFPQVGFNRSAEPTLWISSFRRIVACGPGKFFIYFWLDLFLLDNERPSHGSCDRQGAEVHGDTNSSHKLEPLLPSCLTQEIK
jgi:hypothetical protein